MSPDEQAAFFNTFGFICQRAWFSSTEMESLRTAAQGLFVEDARDHGFDGTERQQIQGFVERHAKLVDLLDDDRIVDIATQLLGPDFIWIGSDGNRYVGETGWHPDGSNLSYRRIKFLFYLDPLGRESGALRLIPGSHLDSLHSSLRRLLQRRDETITPYGVMASRRGNRTGSGFGVLASELPSIAIETNPGDVVLFDQNIWHSSFGGRAGRMMFTMNFGEAPKNAQDWKFVKQMYRGQLEHVRTRQWSRRERLFSDELLLDRRPRLRTLINRLADHDFHR